MSQQEKRAKADKKAAVQAEAIIEAAKAKVAAAPPQKPRRGALSDEHKALAPEVKRMRDNGIAWWAIGHALGLPGSADNVAQGKGGAAFARKIYASEIGAVPRTQARNGSRSASREKNEDIRDLKKQRKRDRVASVHAGKAVIREDMTDEEVVETLRGRTIGWAIDLSVVGDLEGIEKQFLDQEAGVHRRWCKVVEIKGERCISFRQFDPKGAIKYRDTPGATRTVRLRAIHTVR